uniref:Uncharacterized protein n=1 Tax=Arundo donax TaxID=35708 RepID=A0A0A8Y080_ARUDO
MFHNLSRIQIDINLAFSNPSPIQPNN